MATLQSPGVQVTVIDESFYTPSAPGTVPILFVASKQNKTNPSGSIAQGTTAANAGKVWLITSQRDLTDTFGTPVFYTDSSSNPLHGNELNEYGLQAAYSSLGVSSRAYIVRADLDLAALAPTSTRPVGKPVAGTYWVDTATSVFGIKEWNSSTQTFSVKTPLVLDDTASAAYLSSGAPTTAFGYKNDYCMVVTKDNTNRLYYKTNANAWVAVVNGFDSTSKSVQISPHYTYPTWNASTATGSVWVTSTAATKGANWSVKYYNGISQTFTTVNAPIFDSIRTATTTLDATGGKNISVGSVFVDSNYDHASSETANFKLWRRANSGETIISLTGSSYVGSGGTFHIRETLANSTAWGADLVVTIPSTSSSVVSLIPAAIQSQSSLVNISAVHNSETNTLTITHRLGGDFEITDTSGLLALAGFAVYSASSPNSTTANLYAGQDTGYTFIASNWKPLVYEARPTGPVTDPADGTLWYTPVVDEVDILYHNGITWVGYQDSTAFPSTSPGGPIVSATEPSVTTGQSDGTALVNGDVWIDTGDLDMYGRDIYVYNTISGWVKQDVTDQSTPTGWLFADARWSSAGDDVDPDSTTKLLAYNYLDPDAPDPALYPKGMRLWNTRRSGFNVKKYIAGYINTSATSGLNQRYPHGSGQAMGGYVTDRWVSQHPVAEDGGPQFGRLAQRAQVIQEFKQLIDTNSAIRDTDTLGFNLIATPGYPEAIQNMIAFNTDRGITAFVLGDTPFRLTPTGTSLAEWGKNTNKAFDNGAVGATSYDEYMAMWYPSGYTNDNTGNSIVVPPSHMMLRTIINSDAKSYPWFAPAGTRRGGIDNATSVGYITAEGEFKTVALHPGLRDVLQDPAVAINPIATLTGVGVLAYGQRTRAKNASALDRINVARLVCYLRKQLDVLARPFLFEPNDAQTRREIKAAAEGLLAELVGQRGLSDYVVVCDTTNNTPARIDRSELYVDIAVEPVKAVEFIYIPLRLKNTGAIKAGL